MRFKRRNFLRLSALAAGAAATIGFRSSGNGPSTTTAFMQRRNMPPISVEERKQRIAKAQGLMQQQQIGAIILEGSSSMKYFTGISWWPSERTMVAVIPSRGDVVYVCPAFEQDRFKELITVGSKVSVWQEDESPFQLIARTFGDLGIRSGKIGIEEQVRFFISEGIRQAAPDLQYVSADSITIPCRLIKSAAEIALMQEATGRTIAAMKLGMQHLKAGVSPGEIANIVDQAHRDQGAEPDFALILFGASAAMPHGSIKPQLLKTGDIVLMDCGCRVHGYSSDVTRTIVFGAEPTPRQSSVWALEHQAQAAAFSAARIGQPCGGVDAAAREVITNAGYGPGYALPGLPHRTGHGIGIDGHEWGNMVKGNPLLLQAGMCFSIEPTISIPGEFGVRLEDCVYMTEAGPKWFSQPAASISVPFI